jgi:hypothetical protein
MLRWKEHHYARSAQFAQLLTEALGTPAVATPHATVIASPRPVSATPLPKPAAPTAAAVFKSIPWKK